MIIKSKPIFDGYSFRGYVAVDDESPFYATGLHDEKVDDIELIGELSYAECGEDTPEEIKDAFNEDLKGMWVLGFDVDYREAKGMTIEDMEREIDTFASQLGGEAIPNYEPQKIVTQNVLKFGHEYYRVTATLEYMHIAGDLVEDKNEKI